MKNFTMIPTTNPLCQELQRGHNSYDNGAVICKMRHVLKTLNIYFIRFWTRACKGCGTAVTYKDNYYDHCNPCGDTQSEGGE